MRSSSTDAVTLAAALQDASAELAAAGVDDARIEAEVLLCHALRTSRERLYARLREQLRAEDRGVLRKLLGRRLAHEPTAYVVGHKEFYGLELACSPAALIPRPETELVVEVALDWVAGRGSALAPVWIADVGTGNGAIAVALAVHAANVRVVAVDASRDALTLARRNAAAYSVAGRIDFLQGSLLADLGGRFDVIVANLPYVPSAAYRRLPPEIREHEPEAALHAGARGTALIEELLSQARDRLCQDGLLLAEHGWNQGARLRAAARAAFPTARVETRRDLAGLERVLLVTTR